MTLPTPPSLPLPANAVTVTFNLVQQGQLAAVVLGFRNSQPGFAVPTDAQTAVNTGWSNLLQPCMTSEVAVGQCTVRYGNGTIYELAAPTAGGGVGTQSGASGLAAACTLIKWQSSGVGRSGKGRSFIPAPPASAIVNGREYTSAFRTAITSAALSYISNSAWSSTALVPAVVSRTDQTAYPILTASLATVVGLQRRRMRG